MRQRRITLALAGWMLGSAIPAWAAEAVPLTTRVSGVVETVLVKPGQQVKKGTPLVRLDKTVLQARLDQAGAEHALAQAEFEDARRELERAQELYKRSVSSTSELDAATLRHARARALLEAARARRVIAQKDLRDTELKAPFDGVVSAVPGAPGTVVAADCQPVPLVMFSGRP
jgi:RND family efflux transporter MFP subunit